MKYELDATRTAKPYAQALCGLGCKMITHLLPASKMAELLQQVGHCTTNSSVTTMHHTLYVCYVRAQLHVLVLYGFSLQIQFVRVLSSMSLN
jgi:hypothetical protein